MDSRSTAFRPSGMKGRDLINPRSCSRRSQVVERQSSLGAVHPLAIDPPGASVALASICTPPLPLTAFWTVSRPARGLDQA